MPGVCWTAGRPQRAVLGVRVPNATMMFVPGRGQPIEGGPEPECLCEAIRRHSPA
jgi:hypothetical protein